MRIIAIIAFAAIALFFLVRPILEKVPEIAAFKEKIDASQLSFLTRVRVLLKGIKTQLFGRFLMVAGALVPFLQVFDVVDFTQVLPPLDLHVVGIDYAIPAAAYVPGVLVPLIGKIVNWLRAATDAPMGENSFVLEPEKIGAAATDAPSSAEIEAAHAVLDRAGDVHVPLRPLDPLPLARPAGFKG